MDQASIFEPKLGKSRKQLSHSDDIVKSLFANLKNNREREVLSHRYALRGKSKRILADIGQEYGITRERVRQIEQAALSRINREHRGLRELHNIAHEHILASGGVLPKAELHSLIHPEAGETGVASLSFLLALAEQFREHEQEGVLNPIYIVKSIPTEPVELSIKMLVSHLEKDRQVRAMSKLVEILRAYLLATELKPVATPKFTSAVIRAVPVLIVTDEGVGLTSWRELNPKSVRDKTHYILRRLKKPLHFEEIAREINQLPDNKRTATKQAVHNELIKDPRFVLIGRGIYALAEWGYRPGTVKEIIVSVLKEKGSPMHRDEIVKAVLKHRQIKPATVLLNLQDRALFERASMPSHYILRTDA